MKPHAYAPLTFTPSMARSCANVSTDSGFVGVASRKSASRRLVLPVLFLPVIRLICARPSSFRSLNWRKFWMRTDLNMPATCPSGGHRATNERPEDSIPRAPGQDTDELTDAGELLEG